MGNDERKQREKEARRELIIDSACKALLSKGFSSVTMGDIARLSELSVGTIYLYFKNKEELFFSLYCDAMDSLTTVITTISSENLPPYERLVEISHGYKRFSEKQKGYFETISYFSSFPEIMFPPTKRESLAKRGRTLLTLISDIFSEGFRDRGGMESADSFKSALVLWSSLHGLLQFRKMESLLFGDQNFDDLYHFNTEKIIGSVLGVTS